MQNYNKPEHARKIVLLIAYGYTLKEVGVVMGLSIKTVEKWRDKLSLECPGREQSNLRFLRYAIKRGWTTFEKWKAWEYVSPNVLSKNWTELLSP